MRMEVLPCLGVVNARSWRPKFRTAVAMLPVILTTLSALRLPPEGLLARRAVLINAASAAALIGSGPLAASADEASEFLAGVAKAQEKNLGPSVFEGTYTDPFHPGGKRIITLTDTKLGGFQLAKVNGGGGQGEPASFELPAMVSKAPGKQDAQHGQALSMAKRGATARLSRLPTSLLAALGSSALPGRPSP